MSKRIFVLFALLTIVSMLLAACAPAAPAEPAATEPPAMEKPTAAPTDVPQPTTAPAGPPAACESDAIGCATIEPGQTVKIGMAGPMTGDYAAFGTDISQGGLIAIDDLGEFEGFKFELAIEDTQGSPETGAAVANKWAADQTVVAVAGHIFSGETEAAMPIYAEKGIPMLSPSATNPALTQSGSPVFNRIAFTDAVQSKFAAAYLYNNLGIRKLAVMHDGQAYGQALAEATGEEFKALGGEVVSSQAITPGEANYDSALAAVAAGGPEAIYYGGYDAEAAVLVNGLKVAGLENAVFFGCDGTFGENFKTLTGENGEGAYATSLVPLASPEKDTFDAAYLARWGKAAGVLSPFTWNGYDVVAALISAVKSVAVVGDDGNLYIPRDALVKAVRGLAGYKGITGDITCSAEGECNTTGPTFYIITEGAWVQAP